MYRRKLAKSNVNGIVKYLIHLASLYSHGFQDLHVPPAVSCSLLLNLWTINFYNPAQKRSSRSVLRKRCSENMQQIYRRKPMPKCNFNKVALHGCSPVNLLHNFRTPFLKSIYGWLLLTARLLVLVI